MACSSGISPSPQSGANHCSSSSVRAWSTGHMHRSVNAPVSSGDDEVGEEPNEVLRLTPQLADRRVVGLRRGTMEVPSSSGRFSTVSRLWPFGSIVTVTVESS